MKKTKKWYDYLWIWSIVFFILGFFNILFAYLGLVDFILPIVLAAVGKDKVFCNRYCGRGQLFEVLGRTLKLSSMKPTPKILASKVFRYGFFAFFMTMFANMLYITYLVFAGARNLREVVTLLWTFKVPFGWAYTAANIPDGMVQFAFGFYSVMLTSTIIGLIVMLLYRPRSWCAFCPMGTMTQGICKLKHRE